MSSGDFTVDGSQLALVPLAKLDPAWVTVSKGPESERSELESVSHGQNYTVAVVADNNEKVIDQIYSDGVRLPSSELYVHFASRAVAERVAEALRQAIRLCAGRGAPPAPAGSPGPRAMSPLALSSSALEEDLDVAVRRLEADSHQVRGVLTGLPAVTWRISSTTMAPCYRKTRLETDAA